MSKKSKGKKLDADLDVELEEYEPSDSEDDYSEDEKLLLENVRKRRRDFDDESEEEVLGVASDDDEDGDDDDEADDMASDLDGERDDDLPDVKAWGRKKKNFYNTDYVDDDYGGFQKEEEEAAARLEEEEARSIQQRLARQLRDDDFGLDAFLAEDKKSDEKAEVEAEEVIATDLTKLSKRQKLSLVQKESPEFFALTRDFSEKMAVLQEELQPVAALIRAHKVPDCPAARFVTTVYHLVLNYCSNVSFYLLLKALRLPVAAHPIVGRLAKYRRLLAQADAVYRDTVRPQLPELLAADWDAVAATPSVESQEKKQKKKKKKEKKALRLLSAPRAEDAVSDQSGTDREGDPVPREKRKRKAELPEGASAGAAEAAAATAGAALRALADSSGEGDSDDGGVGDGESGEGGERRAITYEMAKNKGLTPYRKKELRNPRVRHRRKYERARVRRKGQVREPRKEVKKYGGEVSGIKIGVTKSIKLKV